VAQIAKLSIASEQASEIIGKGLVDSLLILSNNTSVEQLADDMLDAARNTAAFTEAVAGLANAINAPIKGLANVLAEFIRVTDPFADLIFAGDPSGFMKKLPPSPLSAPVAGFNGKTFYADAQKNAEALAKAEELAKKRAAELLAIKRKQQALEAKILKDKKFAALIDKSNALLAKGEEIFDLDKIQVAAALTSQAEALSKATTQTQVLQIANDTARLNVKRSILALEDAIAAKDEQAIIAATNKLNADLRSLAALTGQNVKLQDIKSILDSLKPKDLINLENLDAALKKIEDMLKLLALANSQAKAPIPTSASLGSGIPAGDYIAPISTIGGSIGAILEYADAASARANAFADLLDMDTAAKTQALQSSPLYDNSGALQSFRQKESATYNVTIQASTIANPDELVNLVQDSLIQINRRGGSLTQAGAL
jgi:hypothetical protein